MALGSEGRKEQTLNTDQDNAIIYEDKANKFREKTRTYFLDFAERVSEQLNDIGFTFCTGGFMAKNPKWTHSLSHWKRNYNDWIENADLQSVMNFSTFFDCRMIYGHQPLIDKLREHIVEKLEGPGEYFFMQLATNALQYEPPLTFFRGIRTISKGDQKVFNIKRAMTPIVDLVRVYALKHKVLKTNTGERMKSLRDQKVFSEEDFHELMQSYYYLMGMRLKHQAHQIIYDHQPPDNFVRPNSFTKIEIVTLKEIFKVIENFQQRIKLIFTRNLFQ
jgi:CBS domain-containing protein